MPHWQRAMPSWETRRRPMQLRWSGRARFARRESWSPASEQNAESRRCRSISQIHSRASASRPMATAAAIDVACARSPAGVQAGRRWVAPKTQPLGAPRVLSGRLEKEEVASVELIEPVNDDGRPVGAEIVVVETEFGVATRAVGGILQNLLLAGPAKMLRNTYFVLSVFEVEDVVPAEARTEEEFIEAGAAKQLVVALVAKQGVVTG